MYKVEPTLSDDELLRVCVLGPRDDDAVNDDYTDATSDDEVEGGEWRDLSEFFPVRYDKERGCHIYYDNQLAREKRVKHVMNESRNMPCHCGSDRKYKKCCLAKDKRGRTWGECFVDREERMWRLTKR